MQELASVQLMEEIVKCEIPNTKVNESKEFRECQIITLKGELFVYVIHCFT